MPNYKISFEQIRQHPSLAIMMQALERGFNKFNIDYYLVGAVSRDVWLSGVHKFKPNRTTGDIDFAVFINDKGVYEALKEYLIDTEEFSPYKENAFVLIYKDGTEVDLLPFGAIEDDNRKVTIQGTGYTNINVDGFKEVYEYGLPEVDIAGQSHFKFCSLPGIVLLKLIAWSDRPETRRDDILDICHILYHFFEMYQETIWEHHNDLFENEEDSLLHIAARVMGRELKQITAQSQKLSDRIKELLEANTSNASSSKIAIIMREYFGNNVEDNVMILREIKMGLEK